MYGQIPNSELDIIKIPFAFPKSPWDNQMSSIVKIGRSHHRYLFYSIFFDFLVKKKNFAIDQENGNQKVDVANTTNNDLSKMVRIEMQINDMKNQLQRVEALNKDYEDKLYGKNCHKITEIHVFSLIFICVLLSIKNRELLMKMKF